MSTLPTHEEILSAIGDARGKWDAGNKPQPEPIGPGEESVWDFPRPPAVEEVRKRIVVEFAGEAIADTTRALRIVETAGAPVYYLPPDDVATAYLVGTDSVSVCEWKGAAVYYDLEVGGRVSPGAAFAYPDPLDDLGQGYARIAGCFGFYAARVDRATIDGEPVSPQPGGLYAGWVTKGLKGPIKGAPGTGHW